MVTHAPVGPKCRSPITEIGEIDLSRIIDVETGPDRHVLSGADVDLGRVLWVSVQNPDGNRNVVVRSSVRMCITFSMGSLSKIVNCKLVGVLTGTVQVRFRRDTKGFSWGRLRRGACQTWV